VITNHFRFTISTHSSIQRYASADLLGTRFNCLQLLILFFRVKRWTNTVDIFSYDLLLFPIHSVDHWSLVAIDLKKDAYTYFDSMEFPTNEAAIETGKEHTKKIL
jgi:hypothetical protein